MNHVEVTFKLNGVPDLTVRVIAFRRSTSKCKPVHHICTKAVRFR